MKAKVKESETVRVERQKAIDIGWAAAAAEAINEMDAEHSRDHKTFFNRNNGSARARGMLEALKALEVRLYKFVRHD